MYIRKKIILTSLFTLALNTNLMAGEELVVDVENSDSAELSAPVAAGKLTKIGTGTLTLSASNSIANTLDIQAGRVNVSSAANFANGSGSWAHISLNGASTIAATQSLTISDITLDNLGLGILLADGSGNVNLHSIDGSGAGNLIISSTNIASDTVTWTGTQASRITINNGHFIVGNTSTATGANMPITVQSGILELAAATSGSVPSAIWWRYTFGRF